MSTYTISTETRFGEVQREVTDDIEHASFHAFKAVSFPMVTAIRRFLVLDEDGLDVSTPLLTAVMYDQDPGEAVAEYREFLSQQGLLEKSKVTLDQLPTTTVSEVDEEEVRRFAADLDGSIEDLLRGEGGE